MKAEVYLEKHFFGEVNAEIKESIALIIKDDEDRKNFLAHLQRESNLSAVRFDGTRLCVELQFTESETVWFLSDRPKHTGNELLNSCRNNTPIELLEILLLPSESYVLPGMTVLNLGVSLNHEMLSTTLRKLYAGQQAA